MLLEKLYKAKVEGRKLLAVLIDPDKFLPDPCELLIEVMKATPPDVLLVGGSLVSASLDDTVSFLKEHFSIPVFLFPGNVIQISDKADGILFMSLISGRNPEFLIGQHVVAAPIIEKTNLETIPVGYVLLENGNTTSVEYMSNTKPIPQTKTDIILATALAGLYLGMQAIYLETGSGAKHTVAAEIISLLRKKLNIPIIVGGGIRTTSDIQTLTAAGADMIVVGTVIEETPTVLDDMVNAISKK